MFTRLSYAIAIMVMTVATLLGLAIATAILLDTAGFISISHFNATTWPSHLPFIGGRTVVEGIARIILFLAAPILALSIYFCFSHVDKDGMEIQPSFRVRWGLPVVLSFGLASVLLWQGRSLIEPAPTLKGKPLVSSLESKPTVSEPKPEPNYTGALKLFKPCEKGMCSDVQ